MDSIPASLSAETVFVPPHQPLRLAQTRFRLLPGVALLSAFVLVGLVLGPYANVAAVSGVRGAQFVDRAIRGALAFPNPQPSGATAPARHAAHLAPSLTTDADTAHPLTAHAPRQRRASAPARRRGPLPPVFPGAHGDTGNAGHGKMNDPGHASGRTTGNSTSAPTPHGKGDGGLGSRPYAGHGQGH